MAGQFSAPAPTSRRLSGISLLAVVLLAGCGSTASSSSPGLVFPPSVAQMGVGGFGRGVEVVDGAPINPFDPIALNNQAVAEAARGRYQHAASLLQRAVKLAPARADIASNLLSLQRWMAQAEGQVSLGMDPQPLQVPLPEAAAPDLPPLWSPPTSTPQVVNRLSVVPAQPAPPAAAGVPAGVSPRSAAR